MPQIACSRCERRGRYRLDNLISDPQPTHESC